MSGSAEITRQNVAAYTVISPVGGEVMDAVRGHYRGEEVTLSSEESKLAEAAEELGMSVAHRADKKSLGQRSVRQGAAAYPEALARMKEYLDALPDMPREDELVSLVERLQSLQDNLDKAGSPGGGDVTKDDILAALQAFDGDVTHQVAGLEIARAQFEAQGAGEAFLSLLDAARGAFETPDLARDVKAGLAVAPLAARAAETLETDPATVRDLYRSLLRETMNVGELFDALGRFATLKSFSEAVQTFMSAAGRDLASTGPSTDPTFLHGLLTELGQLKKMQTTLDAMGHLITLTDRLVPQAERGRADVVNQTSLMLNFASQTAANQNDARRLLGAYVQLPPSVQVAFANGLRTVHADIPDTVMPSMPARQQQVAALMALRNDVVATEENAFTQQTAPTASVGHRTA